MSAMVMFCAALALLGSCSAKAVLEPLRMEDVALEGEYKEAEFRNQEVLLSLNHTECVPRYQLCLPLSRQRPIQVA